MHVVTVAVELTEIQRSEIAVEGLVHEPVRGVDKMYCLLVYTCMYICTHVYMYMYTYIYI